jgi:hypothetical protein
MTPAPLTATTLAQEQAIEGVWINYEANMNSGQMRQRPGRWEYLAALQAAGIVGKASEDALDFLWKEPDSQIGRIIARVEQRHRKAVKR